jgi:hypothetical protein
LILRWLRRLLEALLALLILFEEWGWEPLQRALAWVARLPPLAWLERRVAALPPYAALAAFAVPTLLLLPVKLAALWLIGGGRAGLGLAVILVAKVAGTALVARLFQLTRPALMQLAWFARVYMRWTSWKEALLARVRASWAWRVGRVVKRRVAQRMARWRHAD